MNDDSQSSTSLGNQTDDENLEELMNLYASEREVEAAIREKEEDQAVEDVGDLVKDYPTPQRDLELHGFTVTEAIFELEKFIKQSIHHRIRTVRVITGKGLHSKNMISVVPEEVEKKLALFRREGKVLAFRREKTGGSFAVYLIS